MVLGLADSAPDLIGYVPLARLAERLAGDARTPYDAVEKLEQWFLSSGTFHYSNHPPVIAPPLVGFVTKTHAGYCQYFAGAMALMLRYLGIPARVAVGFAGGTYDPAQHLWNISDREAHAWVEVWFKGYGWLPFDPTPAAPGAAPRETQAGAAGGRSPGIDLVHGRWSNVRFARRVGVRAEAEREQRVRFQPEPTPRVTPAGAEPRRRQWQYRSRPADTASARRPRRGGGRHRAGQGRLSSDSRRSP